MHHSQLTRRCALMGLLCSLLLVPAAGTAQDTLYDPEPPEGSAFVRVVNAGAVPVGVTLGDRDFGSVAPRTSTLYRVVAEGTRDLVAGSAKASFELKAGGFYTVALTAAGEPALLSDPTLSSRAKALVVFYNLADDGTWDLKTADGSVALIEGVGRRGVGSREVNGIKVDLAAFGAGGASAPIAGLQLERGNAYSFLIFPSDDGVAPVWIQNETTTR